MSPFEPNFCLKHFCLLGLVFEILDHLKWDTLHITLGFFFNSSRLKLESFFISLPFQVFLKYYSNYLKLIKILLF